METTRQLQIHPLWPFHFSHHRREQETGFQTLEEAYFCTRYSGIRQNTPNILQIPTRIAGLLERWLQKTVRQTVDNGHNPFRRLVNFRNPDTPIQRLKEILGSRSKNKNAVLHFQKPPA